MTPERIAEIIDCNTLAVDEEGVLRIEGIEDAAKEIHTELASSGARASSLHEEISAERVEYLKSKACQFCFKNYVVSGYTACHNCLYGGAERLPKQVIDLLSQPSFTPPGHDDSTSAGRSEKGFVQNGSDSGEKSGTFIKNWHEEQVCWMCKAQIADKSGVPHINCGCSCHKKGARK